MKIAVLGYGSVGSALGFGWAENGHTVAFGARDPEREKFQVFMERAIDFGAKGGSVAEAVEASQYVVLALPFESALAWAAEAGDLESRIIVDCTNPVGPGLTLQTPPEGSAAEAIAERMTGGRLVKAFNTTGAENLERTAFPEGIEPRPIMPICGDEPESLEKVSILCDDLGFEAVTVGGLKTAHYLESMAMVWIHLARVKGTSPNFTWSFLKR